MTDDFNVPIEELEPSAIFGFDGKVRFGLKVHPDEQHIIHILGTKLTIYNIVTKKQEFLVGHNYPISCVEVSSTGKLIGSGQQNPMGFRSFVILWDWETRKEIARHDIHKVRVESICFTAEDKFLVSLGGQDDNAIIVFDVETKTPIARSVAAKATSGFANTLCSLHKQKSVFIAAGDRHLRIWFAHREAKKLFVYDVSVGKLQRIYTCMKVDEDDKTLYLGTMTGDIVKVSLSCNDLGANSTDAKAAVLVGSYGRFVPKQPKGKDCVKYTHGVRDLYILDSKHLLIGDGEGNIEIVEERNVSFKDYPGPTWPKLKTVAHAKVLGAITSFAKIGKDKFYIGTENCDIYTIQLSNMNLKLLVTCHKDKVYDIAFPKDLSTVFATASYESIRIWSTVRMKELLRIMVYNFNCASIKFSHDGTSIVSAWDDGILRAFTPITGRLIYAIPNAHNKGCSAVTISANGKMLVSGGIEGQVRVWKIEPFRQSLIGVLKEHSAAISTVDFNVFQTEVVSASVDGSCVIWDVVRLTRKHMFNANTQFMCARYYPSGVQILASGSDRKISFWEVYDATLVRELEGSKDSAVNKVAINPSGEYFVSVGNDTLVQLWDYQKGIVLGIGRAHSAGVHSCQFSPDGKYFVTGSAEGGVIIWSIPEKFWPKIFDPLSKAVEKSLSRTASNKSIGSRSSAEGKRGNTTENVEEIENNKNKEMICTECPPVDTKSLPDINEKCNKIK